MFPAQNLPLGRAEVPSRSFSPGKYSEALQAMLRNPPRPAPASSTWSFPPHHSNLRFVVMDISELSRNFYLFSFLLRVGVCAVEWKVGKG